MLNINRSRKELDGCRIELSLLQRTKQMRVKRAFMNVLLANENNQTLSVK